MIRLLGGKKEVDGEKWRIPMNQKKMEANQLIILRSGVHYVCAAVHFL
jgi:hypothetical protein